MPVQSRDQYYKGTVLCAAAVGRQHPDEAVRNGWLFG
jgi:hypothetical protein